MSVLVTSFDRKAAIREVLSTTSATAVYTCESMVSSLTSLRIINTDAALAANITVTITDVDATSYTFYPTTSLAAKGVLDLDFNGHPLFPATDDTVAEKLKVQASVANIIHVIGTVLEFGA